MRRCAPSVLRPRTCEQWSKNSTSGGRPKHRPTWRPLMYACLSTYCLQIDRGDCITHHFAGGFMIRFPVCSETLKSKAATGLRCNKSHSEIP